MSRRDTRNIIAHGGLVIGGCGFRGARCDILFLLSTHLRIVEAPSPMSARQQNMKTLPFYGESYLSIVTSLGAPSMLCACFPARLHPVSGVETREILRRHFS